MGHKSEEVMLNHDKSLIRPQLAQQHDARTVERQLCCETNEAGWFKFDQRRMKGF